jgi:1-aminocyclopropane-1-carboxylate deaminase
MNQIALSKPPLHPLTSQYKFHTMSVLRLDMVHPVVSGNKWFKLKYWMKEAEHRGADTIVTFGGPYSNHILATAAAANVCGFKCVGFIRGENTDGLSPTLRDAESFGMHLEFLSRPDYRQAIIPQWAYEKYGDKFIIIPQGGYGLPGKKGAGEILNQLPLHQFDLMITAVGSGTTLAGLVEMATDQVSVFGVPVLKNFSSLRKEINNLLPDHKKDGFTLLNDYHFGGYAKHTEELFTFMNDWYRRTGIPTDFVYTAKLAFAAEDCISRKRFAEGTRILLIHSGGLQGNRSLPKGTLIF